VARKTLPLASNDRWLLVLGKGALVFGWQDHEINMALGAEHADPPPLVVDEVVTLGR
jgi:hypothetical protein